VRFSPLAVSSIADFSAKRRSNPRFTEFFTKNLSSLAGLALALVETSLSGVFAITS